MRAVAAAARTTAESPQAKSSADATASMRATAAARTAAKVGQAESSTARLPAAKSTAPAPSTGGDSYLLHPSTDEEQKTDLCTQPDHEPPDGLSPPYARISSGLSLGDCLQANAANTSKVSPHCSRFIILLIFLITSYFLLVTSCHCYCHITNLFYHFPISQHARTQQLTLLRALLPPCLLKVK